MRNSICPRCKSNNTVYVGNSQGACNDCDCNFDDLRDLDYNPIVGFPDSEAERLNLPKYRKDGFK